MISARDAKEIVKNSEGRLLQIANRIDPIIRAAAEKGESSVSLSMIDEVSYSCQYVTREHDEIRVLQKRVISFLEAEGFSARAQAVDTPYVPRGLANDDGEGPLYQNYTIMVGW